MDVNAAIQTLVSLVGIGGFLFAVFQYREAQRWKRVEYAANQLQRLESDPDLILATTFLDYSVRGVPLPEKYWDYANTRVFNHDCQKLYRSIAMQYENTPEFFIYTEVFERLFGYLTQIHTLIDMKLIKPSDVLALKWILEDLAKPQWTADDKVFIGRISANYTDVLHLMDLFGIKHATNMSDDEVQAMHKKYEQVIVQNRAG